MGPELKSVKSAKDLGVLILSDLPWRAHVDAVVNKANENQEAFSILYKTLVRPILEYSVPLWCPYLVKDILALEKVQNRATRLSLGQKGGKMDYEYRLKILNWPTLGKRTLFISLVKCFKSVFALNNLKLSDFFELSKSNHTRAIQSFKLYIKNSKCNSYKYSFFSTHYSRME